MKCYFDRKNDRLVYLGKAANDTFWDEHWNYENTELETQIKKNDKFILNCTQKYLNSGSKILEGGCGLGSKVYTLHYHGYDAYGIDYAKETVKKVNQYAPELKVTVGDVRNPLFPDNYFDGYWSLGVIEHFYDGYEKIVSEMLRVLKPNGYLFLTVPVISPLRRIKVRMNKYAEYKESKKTNNNFYQFAFNPRFIVSDLKNRGFNSVDIKSYDGIKGLKDEVPSLKPFLQYLYDSKKRPSRYAKKLLDTVFKYFTNHMCLFVMQKGE